MKIKTSGKINVLSFKGEGLPSIYGFNQEIGPCEIPVIWARRKGTFTYTVCAPSGGLGDSTPVILQDVRLYWSLLSAVRGYSQVIPANAEGCK